MTTILIGYDGSANAQQAIRSAAEVFPGAEAIVLTAWESVTQVSTAGTLPRLRGLARRGARETQPGGGGARSRGRGAGRRAGRGSRPRRQAPTSSSSARLTGASLGSSSRAAPASGCFTARPARSQSLRSGMPSIRPIGRDASRSGAMGLPSRRPRSKRASTSRAVSVRHCASSPRSSQPIPSDIPRPDIRAPYVDWLREQRQRELAEAMATVPDDVEAVATIIDKEPVEGLRKLEGVDPSSSERAAGVAFAAPCSAPWRPRSSAAQTHPW